MRGLAVLILVLAALSGCSATAPAPSEDLIRKEAVQPFPEAATVRLFVESGNYDASGAPILISAQGRTLTGQQRRQFEALLRVETPIKLAPDSDYWAMDACFIPHHFFRYYDGSGRKIGEIAVCFCCLGVAMEPSSRLARRDDQQFHADYPKLKALVASWGEPTDIECS